jgi:hypothetical protein
MGMLALPDTYTRRAAYYLDGTAVSGMFSRGEQFDIEIQKVICTVLNISQMFLTMGTMFVTTYP